MESTRPNPELAAARTTAKARTIVYGGLSYFFWRRREVTPDGAGDAKRN
jgi:hypothetical protein